MIIANENDQEMHITRSFDKRDLLNSSMRQVQYVPTTYDTEK